MADADELARKMAQRQRQEEAERRARVVAEERDLQSRLDADVRMHARRAWTLLEELDLEGLDYSGMQPVILLTYSRLRGRTMRKDAAGWEVASCDFKDHRGDKVVHIIWLLKNGELGYSETGIAEHCIRKYESDKLLPLVCLPQMLHGLQKLIDNLREMDS